MIKTQDFEGADGPFRLHLKEENGLTFIEEWEDLPLISLWHRPFRLIACAWHRFFGKESEE